MLKSILVIQIIINQQTFYYFILTKIIQEKIKNSNLS